MWSFCLWWFVVWALIFVVVCKCNCALSDTSLFLFFFFTTLCSLRQDFQCRLSFISFIYIFEIVRWGILRSTKVYKYEHLFHTIVHSIERRNAEKFIFRLHSFFTFSSPANKSEKTTKKKTVLTLMLSSSSSSSLSLLL